MNENLIVNLEERGVVTATFRKLAGTKKGKIYNAIVAAFGAAPFERVALDIIAKDAGVAKGSLVQYFSTKENLAIFASEILFDRYQEHWERHFSPGYAGNSRDRIVKFIAEEGHYWIEHKAEARFYVKMMHENGAGFADSFREGFHELRLDYMHEILHSGIDSRQISPNADIEAAAALLAAYQGDLLCQIITEEKRKSPESYIAIIKRSVEIVMAGLR